LTRHAVSVTGLVAPDDLGYTLPHEHLFATTAYAFPPQGEEALLPITIERLGAIRADLMTSLENITLDETCDQAGEVAKARDAGIRTIVELTPPCLGRDPERMAAVSRATGVNVVCGGTYYLRLQQRPETREHVAGSSIDALAAEMVSELTEGIGETGIRAGVLGEVGLWSPPHPDELKVLEAAVIAQRETGAPLWVHLMTVPVARDALALFDRCEPLWDRVVFCHMDFDVRDLTWHEAALERGITVEFDFFGSTWWPVDHYLHCPTDPQRLTILHGFAERGYASQLLASHDVCTRVQLTRWGGFGYAYLPTVGPRLLDQLGVDRGLLDHLLLENPRRLLCWAPV